MSRSLLATCSQERSGRARSAAVLGMSPAERPLNLELILLKWSAILSATSVSLSLDRGNSDQGFASPLWGGEVVNGSGGTSKRCTRSSPFQWCRLSQGRCTRTTVKQNFSQDGRHSTSFFCFLEFMIYSHFRAFINANWRILRPLKYGNVQSGRVRDLNYTYSFSPCDT